MVWIMLGLVLLLTGGVEAPPSTTTLFEMKDPIGDNRGDGSLRYPTHQVWSDTKVLDLRHFQVIADDENVYFEMRFGKIDNPFAAVEGYYHQRVEIYINTTKHQGSSKLPLMDVDLELTPKYGWEYRLRVAPYGGTRLYYQDSQEAGIPVTALADGTTIRVIVPQAKLDRPKTSWRYYVLVGAFDALATDDWRRISPHVSPWAFSGSTVPVADILAPSWGPYSQSRQLGEGVLYPVHGSLYHHLPTYRLILFVILVLAVFSWGFFFWRRFKGSNRHGQ